MRFNICFTGPMDLLHLRRDLLMLFKYGLESLGHDAAITHNAIDKDWINLLITPQLLTPKDMQGIAGSGFKYFIINTEIIKNDMMNFDPSKLDLVNAWVPFARKSLGVMDLTQNNMTEYPKYQLDAKFLRWGFHERVEELRHWKEKDLDYFFFGMASARRQKMMEALHKKGFKGMHHGTANGAPHFVRASFIERSKVQLALTQDEKYSHIPSIRICYLANNRCSILCEKAEDPAGYIEFTQPCTADDYIEVFSQLIAGDRWKKQAEESFERFRKIPFTPKLEAVLDHFLGGKKPAQAHG